MRDDTRLGDGHRIEHRSDTVGLRIQ